MASSWLLRNITSFDVSSFLGLFGTTILCYWLIPFLHGLLFAPTRNVRGPLLARLTRYSELGSVLKGDNNLEYIRLHKKYGSVVRVSPNRYSFSDPADVKKIYEHGAKLMKTEFYESLEIPGDDRSNIFIMRDANKHRERRRKIANLYSMSTMVSYEEAVDKMTGVCLRKMDQFCTENRQISLPQFMQYYAFDVIGEITFTKSFDMMNKEADSLDIIKDLHGQLRHLAQVGLVPGLNSWVHRYSRLVGKTQSTQALGMMIDTQVSKFREANKKGDQVAPYDSFLKKLIELEAESKVGPIHIFDSCGSNIGAGSDTTGITLSTAFWYLYRNPDKLSKLRQEIDTLAAEGKISDPITFQEAQKMPYLQAVIKESLRIHPAVGTMLPRKVPKGGIELAGTYFPEGTDVGANAWVLHHNKDIYGEDVDDYRPERWLEEKCEGDLKDSMMFAFGAGSRTCIGKNISLLEINKVVPQIVRKFDIIFENDEPLKTYAAWFVFPDFNVQVKPRE